MSETRSEPLLGATLTHGVPRHRLVLLAIVAGVVAVSFAVAYAIAGTEMFAAVGVGAVFGGAVAALGVRGVGRASEATGHALVQQVMMGLLVSFGAFMIGVIVLGLLWREGVAPAALTALAVYLAAKFFEVFAAQGSGRRDGTK